MASATELIERQGQMLANRVRKTSRQLARKFARESIDVYRLYDRDIPEIRVVIDRYGEHLVAAEYARAQTDAIDGWFEGVMGHVARALQILPENLHLKRRQTRRGVRYERLADRGERLTVQEGPVRFLVNLDDFIDTGLFGDHRQTRARVRAEVAGRRFLNLYAYTGAFTVHAAAGGAAETLSVDLSRRYVDWIRDNLELNGLTGPQHGGWALDVPMALERLRRDGRSFDLVVLDPPSASVRSGAARGERALDIQRDHADLVAATLEVLEPGGVLYFSTNHQRFEPRLEGIAGSTTVEEITHQTVPPDYRNRRVHRAFRLVKGASTPSRP